MFYFNFLDYLFSYDHDVNTQISLKNTYVIFYRTIFGLVSKFPPTQNMSGQTTKQLVGEVLSADLGKRHFSKWTTTEHEELISLCGLSPSQFKNKTESITIFTHLHTTPLTTENLYVTSYA